MPDAPSVKLTEKIEARETLAKPITECIKPMFPTPIILHDWPDSEALNADLKALVLSEENSGPKSSRSNVGGWHSPIDFLHRDTPPITQLLGRIQTMIRGLIPEMMDLPEQKGKLQIFVEGWANLLRAGGYNTIHNHPNTTWAGVYYVTGNPPLADGKERGAFDGKLEFVDPRPAASISYVENSKLSGRCMVAPEPGRMVLFPCWLQHFVHPCSGEGERISIAFNVKISGLGQA